MVFIQKGDFEALENKRSTKLIPSVKHKNYAERLKICHLTTLRFPR